VVIIRIISSDIETPRSFDLFARVRSAMFLQGWSGVRAICARAERGCAVPYEYKRDIRVRVRRAKDRGTAAAETGVPKGRYSTMCYIVGFAEAPLLSAFVYQRRKCSAYCYPPKQAGVRERRYI